jgi:AhpD family alkylhydroperoxidase
MSRLAGPRRPSVFARFAYWMAKRGYGALEWETGRAKAVDTKLKDLAGTKAAVMVGCEFCIDIASAISTKSGVTAEQLADLPRYRDSEHFDETEKLVLDYAVAMTSTPAAIPDELFEALRKRFDERQLVELTAAIALENYRARFNWAFGIGSQGFAESGACALPEPQLRLDAREGAGAV